MSRLLYRMNGKLKHTYLINRISVYIPIELTDKGYELPK